MRRSSAGRFPSSRLPTRGAVAAICGLAAAYLIFVVHYSVNGLLLDDWGFVHLVHAAEHGRLTLGELWAQHNENRMFVPNVMMVGLALVTHDDTRTAIVVSALVFDGSYVAVPPRAPDLPRPAAHGRAGVGNGCRLVQPCRLAKCFVGLPFAWYLILFLLMAILCLLSAVPLERRGPVVFAGAVAIAVAASYSSAQGVFLWAVGLLCLLRPLRGSPLMAPSSTTGSGGVGRGCGRDHCPAISGGYKTLRPSSPTPHGAMRGSLFNQCWPTSAAFSRRPPEVGIHAGRFGPLACRRLRCCDVVPRTPSLTPGRPSRRFDCVRRSL